MLKCYCVRVSVFLSISVFNVLVCKGCTDCTDCKNDGFWFASDIGSIIFGIFLLNPVCCNFAMIVFWILDISLHQTTALHYY